MAAPVSHFVNRWETETDCEQPVLLAHRPGARKAEPLAQPQHGFEALDRAPRRVEGLEAAHPRHGPLDPEVVALDPLLQMLGDVMHRRARQEPVFPGCRDGGWVGPRPIGADPVRGEQRLVFQRLAEEALGRLQVALRRQQEVHGRAMLINGPVQIPPLAADLDVWGVSQTFNARKNRLRTVRRDACSPTSTRSVKRFDGPDIALSDRSAPMLEHNFLRQKFLRHAQMPHHPNRPPGNAWRASQISYRPSALDRG